MTAASAPPALLVIRVHSQGGVLRTGPAAAFGAEGGSIGRDADNVLALPDPGRTVSRRHAAVTWHDGAFRLHAEGRNRTRLNGGVLAVGDAALLEPGDRIEIGDYVLVAEAPDGAEPPPTTAWDPLAELLADPAPAPGVPTGPPAPPAAAALPGGAVLSWDPGLAATAPPLPALTPAPRLGVEVALLSDRGGRRHNEDACGHWHSGRALVCVLADGAGGHGGGDIASRLVVSELIGRFARTPGAAGPVLGALLREANRALIAERVPGTPRQDMHSTVAALVLDVDDGQAHWAWAGDSRLYAFRGGRVALRTRDHSLVQALVDGGVITAPQALLHPRRSELRSALGLPDDQLEVGSGGTGAAADGAALAGAVQPGDCFLLCSDGLWEYLDDATLEATLAAAPGPAAWLGALEAALRGRVAHKPQHDNFSAVAVWTREPSPPTAG